VLHGHISETEILVDGAPASPAVEQVAGAALEAFAQGAASRPAWKTTKAR
jgi:hypothetical protein